MTYSNHNSLSIFQVVGDHFKIEGASYKIIETTKGTYKEESSNPFVDVGDYYVRFPNRTSWSFSLDGLLLSVNDVYHN